MKDKINQAIRCIISHMFLGYQDNMRKKDFDKMIDLLCDHVALTLKEYSEHLENNGYTDSDWREEIPNAVDRYLNQDLK